MTAIIVNFRSHRFSLKSKVLQQEMITIHRLNAIPQTFDSWVQCTLLIRYFTKAYVSSVLLSSILFLNKTVLMLSACGKGPGIDPVVHECKYK